MIVDYIDSHRESFGVEPVCAVLAEAGIAIAPSTYYARSKAPLTDAYLADAYLANQLRSLWQDNWGVYGARKLWHAARRAGHHLGRDQVARVMKIAGISGVLRGKHRTITTRRDDAAPRHPDLVKRGWHAPTGIDQLWVADFSYVWTWLGSSVSRSSSTCSPAGSWAGGLPPPSTPAWSPTPSGRRCRSAAAANMTGWPPV
jgi:putative transposase